MIIAFIFALLMNFFSYWFSDRIVLAMYGAKKLSREEAPEVHKMVEELCREANLPLPKIYLIPSENPNAFATGRDPKHASVAVTKGILGLISPEELKGVLAHELAHVKNRDILVATIAATIAGTVMFLARMLQYAAIFGGQSRDNRERGGNPLGLLLFAVLAPIAALIIQMAISRSREYQADETGGRISRNPLGLARALEKLESYTRRIPMFNARPNTAHLFIVNPLRGRGLVNLFSTHPPISERIKRLEKLAEGLSG